MADLWAALASGTVTLAPFLPQLWGSPPVCDLPPVDNWFDTSDLDDSHPFLSLSTMSRISFNTVRLHLSLSCASCILSVASLP